MKRILALTSLSLTAVLLVPTVAGAQAPTPIRAATKRVTSTTTPARDRTRPYRFTTRGRVVPPPFCPPGVVPTTSGAKCFAVPVVCPPGNSNPLYCQRPVPCPVGAPTPGCVNLPNTLLCLGGRVSVKIQRAAGSFTISSRTVRVGLDCRFRSSVTFRTRNPLRRGRFRVKVRFLGNAFLLPRSAPTRFVRAG